MNFNMPEQETHFLNKLLFSIPVTTAIVNNIWYLFLQLNDGKNHLVVIFVTYSFLLLLIYCLLSVKIDTKYYITINYCLYFIMFIYFSKKGIAKW